MNPTALLKDKVVLASIGAVVVIAIGSAVYYTTASKAPVFPQELAQVQTAMTTTGTVEPVQNPNLAFQSGGKVVRIAVKAGDKVGQGQLLASLDIASLAAQRAQAAANLKAQEAKLDGMQSGPRDVDVSTKQTAVSQAELTLDNAYQSAINSINDAYGKSSAGVHTYTDTLFSNPNTTNPTIVFLTVDSSLSNDLMNMRLAVNDAFQKWQQRTATLSSASSNTDIESALADSLTYLATLRIYSNATVATLGQAISTTNFTQSTISANLASATTFQSSISTLIASLQSAQQQLAADKLAVQSAKDSLNQVLAGATKQDIEVQQALVEAAAANVDAINAQIRNSTIVAPFSGTVASVQVKVGDIVSPNTVGISLNPGSALQITSYVSEADMSRLSVGQVADITLDAYGADRHFPATIVSIDHAPTMQNKVPAYKVVLQFGSNDAAIASGMTANITFAQSQ